jgi:hypothetical protein
MVVRARLLVQSSVLVVVVAVRVARAPISRALVPPEITVARVVRRSRARSPGARLFTPLVAAAVSMATRVPYPAVLQVLAEAASAAPVVQR